MRERRSVKIRGSVQGVFFRETVRRLASRYDVYGFVRNVGLETLEIEAEGEPAVVEAFIADVLAHPPAVARIEDVRSTPMEARGDVGFSIAPSAR
jgi:hydrogenase maturation factor HypF (carbamoyltransferase family)